MKANLQRASCWWKAQDTILEDDKVITGCEEVTRIQLGVRKKFAKKRTIGWGRKCTGWVTGLFGELFHEFERLKKARVKFSRGKLVIDIAKGVFQTFVSKLNHTYVDPLHGVSIISKSCTSWMRSFMHKRNIVLLHQTRRKHAVLMKIIDNIEMLKILTLEFSKGVSCEESSTSITWKMWVKSIFY